MTSDKHKYPIGSGRVVFSSTSSYAKAIRAAFVELRTQKFSKKIQIDPFLENSMCCICVEPGPYFCRDAECFKYYCKTCWKWQHSFSHSMSHHSPMMRNPRDTDVAGAPSHPEPGIGRWSNLTYEAKSLSCNSGKPHGLNAYEIENLKQNLPPPTRHENACFNSETLPWTFTCFISSFISFFISFSRKCHLKFISHFVHHFILHYISHFKLYSNFISDFISFIYLSFLPCFSKFFLCILFRVKHTVHTHFCFVLYFYFFALFPFNIFNSFCIRGIEYGLDFGFWILGFFSGWNARSLWRVAEVLVGCFLRRMLDSVFESP